MKQTLMLFVLPVLVALGCTTTGKVASAPPPDATAQTRKKLETTKGQLAAYYQEYGCFPKTLKDLSWVNGGETYEDAWGNELAYMVGQDKTVRLWSFGADGRIGGTGDNQDIEFKFNVLDVTPSVAEQIVQPKKKWF